MTFARRLAAAGFMSIVLAAATASLATARDDGSPPPATCEVLVILALPCELSLPPAPVIDLPVEPVVTELVPARTEPVEELVPLLVTELVPAPFTGLLQPVVAIGPSRAAEAAAASGAAPQSAVDPPAARTDGTPATPEAGGRLQDDPGAPQARATVATAPTTGSRPQLGHAQADGSAGPLADDLATTPPPFAPAIALTLTLGGGAALAVELARGRRQLGRCRCLQRLASAAAARGAHEPAPAGHVLRGRPLDDLAAGER